MVDRVEESAFWLPPEFLDDLLTDGKIISEKSKRNAFDADFCFPSEFPYDNMVDAKSRVMSTSPQSTLTRLGSFSGHASDVVSPDGVTSPTAAPFTHAVEDLIHLAAGQVARLKLHGVDRHGLIHPKSHIRHLKDLPQVDAERSSAAWLYGLRHQQVGQNRKITEHHPLSGATRIPNTGLAGRPNRGVGQKTCAGTGVFLPRRYNNDDRAFNNSVFPAELRRKTADLAAYVHKPSHHMGRNHYNVESQHLLFANYEMSMGRRNALMLQQQQKQTSMMLMESSLVNRGIYLPHEWTY